MPRTAKIFMNNRSQAVRLPKEYQFNTPEVFIRKQGERSSSRRVRRTGPNFSKAHSRDKASWNGRSECCAG
jgi:virulence-associated protein VagC